MFSIGVSFVAVNTGLSSGYYVGVYRFREVVGFFVGLAFLVTFLFLVIFKVLRKGENGEVRVFSFLSGWRFEFYTFLILRIR